MTYSQKANPNATNSEFDSKVIITPDKDHGDLISELLQITAELGGEMERSDCADSSGLYWKKIVITYDVHEKKK